LFIIDHADLALQHSVHLGILTVRSVTGGIYIMAKTNHPEQHMNEEPRNDFMDTAIGFAGMFTFMLVVAILFTVIEVLNK